MRSSFKSQSGTSRPLKLCDITSLVENQAPQAPGAKPPPAVGGHPKCARGEPQQEMPKISPRSLRLIVQIDRIRNAVESVLDSSDSDDDDEFAQMELKFRAMKELFQSGSYVQATQAQLDEQAIRRTEEAKREGRDTAEHRRLDRLRKGRCE